MMAKWLTRYSKLGPEVESPLTFGSHGLDGRFAGAVHVAREDGVLNELALIYRHCYLALLCTILS